MPLAPNRWPVASPRMPLAPTRWPLAPNRWPVASPRMPLAPTRWPLAPLRWPVASPRMPIAPPRWPVASPRMAIAPPCWPLAPTRWAIAPLLLALLVVPGCPGRPPVVRGDGGTSAGAPPAGTGPGRTASASASASASCELLREQIRTLIAGAPSTCTTAQDCRAYPGGPVNCGGVVARETATRLWQLTSEFRERKCRFAVHCGPRAVEAVCRDGRCAEQQLGMGGTRP